MGDPAHEETEKLIKQMEKRINQEYAQAEKELQEKLDDYMRRFHTKDKKWREWVADGTKTKEEYKKWKTGQLAVGKRWESMKQTIAEDMYNADQIAKSIVKGYMPEVYALNFNYGTYEAEVGAQINTGFTLYDKQTVERIMRDDPDLLPAPGKKVSKAIAEGKAIRWNKQVIQSVMTQGIIQGESIPKLATRLAEAVGETNRKAAIRNARTMATGAQNAGREDAYKRAVDKGVDMMQEWEAVYDNRTRHEHRLLDGQIKPVGEPFEVEGVKIKYPGDLSAPGYLVYNCRCTLAGVVKGFTPNVEVEKDDRFGGMSYDEWKNAKAKSNPITLPEEKSEAIKHDYILEYEMPKSKVHNYKGDVGLVSVKNEYENSSTPSQGSFVIQENRKMKNREEQNMKLLYKKYGGDIEAIQEGKNRNQKYADYQWKGKLWEEQEPIKHTKNAVDQNIREAIKQIADNPGGIVLDIGDSEMNIDEIEKIAFNRLNRSASFDVDLIIIRNGIIEEVFKYKK